MLQGSEPLGTKELHPLFKDLEHKILYNELRARHGSIYDLGKHSLQCRFASDFGKLFTMQKFWVCFPQD